MVTSTLDMAEPSFLKNRTMPYAARDATVMAIRVVTREMMTLFFILTKNFRSSITWV